MKSMVDASKGRRRRTAGAFGSQHRMLRRLPGRHDHLGGAV